MMMLRCRADGRLLADSLEQGLHLTARGDDTAMWQACGVADEGGTPNEFVSALTGARLAAGPATASAGGLEKTYRLETDGLPALYDAVVRFYLKTMGFVLRMMNFMLKTMDFVLKTMYFLLQSGPDRLPSSHLAELRATGFSVFPGFSGATCAAMRAAVLESVLYNVVGLGGLRERLQLSVPRARRGSTGGEGIQVFRDGSVVQGAPDEGGASTTILWDSITAVETTQGNGSKEMASVRVSHGGGLPFEFGCEDADAAASLCAKIQQVVTGDQDERADFSSGRGKGFWDGDSGHLFGRMHCHPVMLWLLEQVCAVRAPLDCAFSL